VSALGILLGSREPGTRLAAGEQGRQFVLPEPVDQLADSLPGQNANHARKHRGPFRVDKHMADERGLADRQF